LTLYLDRAWCESHPLIEADLENERAFLRGAKYKLVIA
jgi:exopolyphosphatase/guanosine-5'-triphosphate,3'-diphosphate pyrophosphatase